MQDRNKKNRKIAIIVATPFQAMNAINLAHNILCKDDYKVLYYRNFSSQTNAILNKIKQHDLFNEIIEFNLLDKTNKIIYCVNALTQAIYPSLFIAWLTKSKSVYTDFDYVTTTSATEFELALIRCNPQANVVAYDDGLGSYTGDIIHDEKLNFIWRVLGRNKDIIKPICLYVNNIEFCHSTSSSVIKKLPSLSESTTEYLKVFNDVFNTSLSKVYENRRMVFLTEPIEEYYISCENYSEMLQNCLEEWTDGGVIRKHPRDNDHYNIEGFVRDENNCLWEAVCEKSISNNHILISLGSTAQITPKLLYGSEPWVIFTYKLGRISNEVVLNTMEKITCRLKEYYTDPKKILVPETFDDLSKIFLELRRYGGENK